MPKLNYDPQPLHVVDQANIDAAKKRLLVLTQMTSQNLGFGPGIPNTKRSEAEHNANWLTAINALPDARPIRRISVEHRFAIETVLAEYGLKIDSTTSNVVRK